MSVSQTFFVVSTEFGKSFSFLGVLPKVSAKSSTLTSNISQLAMEMTERLVKTYELTTLMVSYDMELAINHGNRLVMLHQSRIIEDKGDLVFNPMAGGAVVPDTCLAFQRKCWSFDIVDCPETRFEIEPFQWNPRNLQWPIKGKEKLLDLLFLDHPYFKKMAEQYVKESILGLSRKEYLRFFLEVFSLTKEKIAFSCL